MQQSVKERYADAAKQREASLCCPVDYNEKYLKIIPQEVIEKDYGCGDPSKFVQEGETVLDLGSGGGKICFIAAQIVGPQGKVIGVDGNPTMLDLARRNTQAVTTAMGYNNLTFKYGFIQDLALNLEKLNEYLEKNPIKSVEDLQKLEQEKKRLRKESPLIEDASVDVIVSNCVLNLVDDALKKQLFKEMFRVLKDGGKIAISDIVSDKTSPAHLKENDELWSGCISGALRKDEFLEELALAGFNGITIEKFDEKPWQTVEDINYHAMTVVAYKNKKIRQNTLYKTLACVAVNLKIMIGYIVGSGFYNQEGYTKQLIETKWGSAEVLTKPGGSVTILPRHGENHEKLPHHISYRANIAALKQIGCTAIISCSVVGALQKEITLGKPYVITDLYFPENRLPDGEVCSFFNTPGAPDRGHLIAGSLFNKDLSDWLAQKTDAMPANYVYAIGPRFNTKMEIAAYQNVGGDLISQTCGPEAVLTNELKIPYAQLAFAIDYANGVTETPTSIEELNANLAKSTDIFKTIITEIEKEAPKPSFTNFIYEFV